MVMYLMRFQNVQEDSKRFQQVQDNQEGLKKGSIMSFNDQEDSRMWLNVNKGSTSWGRAMPSSFQAELLKC